MIRAFFEAIKEFTSDELKEKIGTEGMSFGNEMLLEVGIDTALGSIPMVGNGFIAYKMSKEIENAKQLILHLYEKHDELEVYIRNLDEIGEQKADMILDYAFEKAKKTEQKDKIKYIANGISNILKTKELSFDISKLYLDTLDRLSLLDIAIVEYYANFFNQYGISNQQESVQSSFGITDEIYNGARINLRYSGLLETQSDKNLQPNIKSIESNISDIIDEVNSIIKYLSDPKKKYKGKKIRMDKINTRSSYKISKFGKDFYDYVLDMNENDIEL